MGYNSDSADSADWFGVIVVPTIAERVYIICGITARCNLSRTKDIAPSIIQILTDPVAILIVDGHYVTLHIRQQVIPGVGKRGRTV